MRFHSISMVNLKSVAQRYDHYDWRERHRGVRYLSIWLLIFGGILILAGVGLSGLLISGKITLPYSAGVRVAVTAGVFILGLLLGSALLAMSRILSMVVDVERSTRFASNIWFILEERTLPKKAVRKRHLRNIRLGMKILPACNFRHHHFLYCHCHNPFRPLEIISKIRGIPGSPLRHLRNLSPYKIMPRNSV